MTVTSSIPAAIDYVVEHTRDLPVLATFGNDVLVGVFDGWPGRADIGICIGITPEDPETGNDPTYAELGAQMEWEEYAIPCIIWAYQGGGEEAMKPARDNAFAVLNAFMAMIRSDRTLGGALHSGAAAVRAWRVEQTGTAEEAGSGRTCTIRFNITGKNRF